MLFYFETLEMFLDVTRTQGTLRQQPKKYWAVLFTRTRWKCPHFLSISRGHARKCHDDDWLHCWRFSLAYLGTTNEGNCLAFQKRNTQQMCKFICKADNAESAFKQLLQIVSGQIYTSTQKSPAKIENLAKIEKTGRKLKNSKIAQNSAKNEHTQISLVHKRKMK